jgi:hypothetical protein
MTELNASLETSKPNNQANSQPDNNGAEPNKNGKAFNKQQDDQAKQPKSLAELFGSKSDESSTEIALDDDTPDDAEAPLDSIDRLMKRHKLTADQAYGIKVPMPNGAEALTIGELKDKISELTDFEVRVVQFDERRIKQEGELLRSQAELKELIGVLPKDAIKPEVLQKLRERQAETTKQQRQLTLEHIPEWRDEKKRTTEIEGIVEMLSDYGFDESFLQSVVDHRAMKFIRDTFLIRSRIRKSLEQVRDPKKLGKQPSGKSNKSPIKPSNNSSTRKQAAVTQGDKIRDWFQSKE